MEEFKGFKQLIEHRMPSGLQASATLPLKNQESVVVSNTIGNDQSPLTLRPCKMMSWPQEVVTLGRAYIGNGPQQIHSNLFQQVTIRFSVKGKCSRVVPK